MLKYSFPFQLYLMASTSKLKTRTYAACPSCHFCHPPTFLHCSSKPTYPSHCTNTILEQGICGSPLLQGNDTDNPQPIKPFIYHHIHDFIGNLLAQEDLERHIDDACDGLKSSVDKNKEIPHFVHNIFQAPFMCKVVQIRSFSLTVAKRRVWYFP